MLEDVLSAAGPIATATQSDHFVNFDTVLLGSKRILLLESVQFILLESTELTGNLDPAALCCFGSIER
jgi:hypothetical protein